MPVFTESGYIQCVREQIPDLAIRSSRLNSSDAGQFNAILFVNEDAGSDAFVFRFPRVEEALRDLPNEIRLLRALQGRTLVPVPNPIYVSADLHTMGRTFMGYRKLSGQPLLTEALNSITDKAKRNMLAQQLAEFLKSLHGLDSQSIGLRLQVEDSKGYWRAMLADFETHLFPHMRREACQAVRTEFDTFLNNSDNFNFRPALTHTDFGGGNILFDASTVNITGIIDWAGATLGDPAVDAAAVEYMGEEFFACMVNIYPALIKMMPRARFYQSTFVLQEALNAKRGGDYETFKEAIARYQ